MTKTYISPDYGEGKDEGGNPNKSNCAPEKSEMEVTLKNTEMPRYTIVFKIDKNAMLKI